jgi:hypothetical protein
MSLSQHSNTDDQTLELECHTSSGGWSGVGPFSPLNRSTSEHLATRLISKISSPMLTFRDDDINQLVNNHESFSVRPDCDLSGLPKFYSIGQYGASEDVEIKLWKEEIHRLVEAVNSGKPHQIGGEDEWFGKANEAGFARLDQLVMQIEHAWMVCDLDNELIALDHSPDLANMQKILKIEQHLRREYDVSTQKIRYKRPIGLEHYNDECYYELVDHLTANLAQILARMASGKFWEGNFIATLAKLSAKLKWLVLTNKMPPSVSTVVHTKSETLEKLKAEGRHLPTKTHGSETRGKTDKETEETNEHRHDDGHVNEDNINGKGNRYFVVQMAFHNLLSHLCETALDHLSSNEDTGIASDIFETSVVIYDSSFSKRREMICGLRDGGIGGLGNRNALRATQAAVQVCGDLFLATKADKKPENTPPGSTECSRGDSEELSWVSLYWHWDELGDDGPELGARGSINTLSGQEPYKGRRRFYQMKSVINVLVPMQMLFGNFAAALDDKFINISTIAPTRDQVLQATERRFVGTTLLQTSTFQRRRQKSGRELGICSVWETPLAQARGLAPR